MNRYYPTRSDLDTPEKNERTLRRVCDLIYETQQALANSRKSSSEEIRSVATATTAPRMQAALQVGGGTPLNVTGLTGLLADVQKAAARTVTVLPDVLSSQDGELVSLNKYLYRFDGSTEPGTWQVVVTAGAVLMDTHANRLLSFPAASYPVGTLFYETDRRLIYRDDGTDWRYFLGTWRTTFASITTIRAGVGLLTALDDGLLLYTTDFLHTWRWDGTLGVPDFVVQPQFSQAYPRTQAQIAAVAALLNANDTGFLVYATDWLHTWRWNGATLVFEVDPLLSRAYPRTQAQVAAVVALLTANDVDFKIYVSNYDHNLRWNGANFIWDYSEQGSGFIGWFIAAPTFGVWQVCDGTATNRLTSAGGLSAVTVPNFTTARYVKAATAYTGPAAAAGAVAAESAHTHDVDPPNTTSAAPSATTTVDNDLAASTVAVGSDVHTHDTDIASFASGAGSAHDHAAGTLELSRVELIAYYRL